MNKYKREKRSYTKNESKRPFFWRWEVVTAIVIGLISLYGIFFLIPKHEKDVAERQLEYQDKIARKQLEYQIEPSVILSFEPGKGFFTLKNQGPGRLERVWFVETVFLVDSEGVHECPDFPHFEYYHFEGKLRTMGVLEAGEERQINLTPCWRQAFGHLLRKYPGELISRFTLTGTSLASPKFITDFFFIIDTRHSDYITADKYIGGKTLIERISKYIDGGPKSVIRWVCFEGPCVGFYKNPARYWYVSVDSQYVPWHGPSLPPVELSAGRALLPIFFTPYVFLPNKDSYAKLSWSCDSITGPTAILTGSVATW